MKFFKRAFSATPANLLARRRLLLNALRSHQVKMDYDQKSDVQVLSLPDGVTWLHGDQHLFVRRCTRDLHAIVSRLHKEKRSEGVVLTGNPGIGKSFSINYFLHEWAAKANDNSSFVFHSIGENRFWHFQGDQVTATSQPNGPEEALDDPSTFYAMDPLGATGAREPVTCSAFTAVFSSPNKAHFHQFLKRVRQTRFFPVWSLPELETMARFQNFPLDVLHERFEAYGGIPLFMFVPGQYAKNEVGSAIAGCDASALLTTVGCHPDAAEANHRLLHYSVAPNSDYQNVTLSWASQAVADKVLERAFNTRRQDIEIFLQQEPQPQLECVRGPVFEKYAHKALAHGGEFKVLKLNGPNKNVEQTLTLPPLPTFRTSPEDKVGYFCPTQANAKVFDAFVQFSRPVLDEASLLGLQMTVSVNKRVSSALFAQACKEFSVPGLRVLVYVVPPDISPHGFAIPKLPGVSQWMLRLPIG